MSATTSRKETERTKLIQDKCQTLLTQMLRDEDNKYCVDCDAKGPRWASWNLGVFLCIRCAGIHRNLGVHISRVKSVNLDTWTPEQVVSLQQMGNSRARAVYEAQLPDGFRRPQTDTALESFIRAKYEHKKYLAREWVPPMAPKVDWAKEIDDELERQKRKKKSAQANSSLGIGVMSGGGGGGDKKSLPSAKSSPLPAPLPKPKPGQSGSSPKTHRNIASNSSAIEAAQSNDLLGLSSPTKPTPGAVGHPPSQDLQNDTFSGFLSATPADHGGGKVSSNGSHAPPNSLAQEEEDFFNQGSLLGDKDKSGKLTKDSILALYATAAPGGGGGGGGHNPSMSYVGQAPAMMGGFTGMAPGFMGACSGSAPPQAQHAQFMTPPNSASMYNAPVMTTPVAFTAPGMGGMHLGAAAAAQQHIYGMGGYQQQQQQLLMLPGGPGGGGSIMATGQPSMGGLGYNLLSSNQSFLGGMSMAQQQQPPVQPMSGLGMASLGGQPSGGGGAGTNLNQQFGNLNIGNVWQ